MIETLEVEQVARLIHISQNYVWTLVRKGEIPPPIHVSKRGRIWKSTDFDAFFERRRGRREDDGESSRAEQRKAG
jgi:predicted DNA-binding transcriptional regulator AlpA